MENHYTIKEVAEILGVSTKTIRRRIKSREIKAELIEGAYGEQYFISKSEIDRAVEIVDVVKVRKEHDIKELALALSMYYEEKDNKVLEHIEQLNKHIEDMKESHKKEIKELKEEIRKELRTEFEKAEGQRKSENQKLADYIEHQRREESKSFWSRLFKK